MNTRSTCHYLTAAFLVAAGVLLATPAARAVAINLAYRLNYYPPNPCIAGATLAGSISILDADGNPLIPNPGPPGTPCDTTSTGVFAFDAAPGTNVYLSFAGLIQIPTPGPPDAPVYAFPVGTDAVADDPGSAPLLLLGTMFSGGILVPNPGPPDFPLFAFASPGTLVGSLSITPVPEPATVALLMFGLAGLGLVVRRRHAS